MVDKEYVLNLILSHFKVIKRVGNTYYCLCPHHKDKNPSLHITMGDKKIIMDCKAGCDYRDILADVGLKPEQLYYDYYEKDKPNTNWRGFIESRENRKIEAVYNYTSITTGKYAFTKIRLEGKKMLYGKLANDRFTYGIGHDTPRKSYKAVYGDLQAIQRAIKEGKPIYIPEGEKDVDTLTKHGYTSFTYGGVNDWQKDFAELVKGACVVVLADNDEAGLKAANTILHDIQSVAKSTKIVIPTPDIPKGDVSDYFQAGHSKQEFEQLVNSTVRNTPNECVVKCDVPAKDVQSLVDKLTEINAAAKYETNDKGFARLYARIFKDKHRYNSTVRDFMLYDGKRWIEDTEGLSAKADAKILSDALIRYATTQNDVYMRAVMPLCNAKNRNNMIQDSKDINYFTNELLDNNDYLLNVQNGTLDLSNDETKFIEHSPDMLLSKICNAEYDPNAKCEKWQQFLQEIMQGDADKIKYLQKIAGLSLTGSTQEETCFILFGSTTRNGKSTYCETIIHLLGDYAITMRPETLAQKQNSDSRQASGDIARLANCRFCNASEPSKRMIFDVALLKTLLGRDSITARHLYQREFSFIPKFKLVINTNYLPTITDDTIFSSGRINVVSFDRHFEPQEQDKCLKNKLRDKNELSGILNWCIEGLKLYRHEGLEPPQAVKAATEAYRSDSDKIGNFIKECLVKTGNNSKAKDVYDTYSQWCSDNGYGCENKGNFFAELKNKGLFAVSGTVSGKTSRNIVRGYEIVTEFVSCEGEEPPEFN